jgi:hypothetical protein
MAIVTAIAANGADYDLTIDTTHSFPMEIPIGAQVDCYGKVHQDIETIVEYMAYVSATKLGAARVGNEDIALAISGTLIKEKTDKYSYELDPKSGDNASFSGSYARIGHFTGRKYNPSVVIYKPLQVVNIPRDRDFDEPSQGQRKVYGAAVTTVGQVWYDDTDELEVALTGDPGVVKGHLTIRRSDVVRDGVTWSKGDLITSIAGFAVNYSVVDVIPRGHLKGVYNTLEVRFGENRETNAALRR